MGNKNNNYGMDPWKEGDIITARHLDQPRQVLSRQSGIAPGSQVSLPPVPQMRCQLMQVIDVQIDYIRCYRADSNGKSDDIVNVAMPHLLQQTHYQIGQPPNFRISNRKGISYSYATPQKRTATNADGDEEIQVIVGSYEEGDILVAFTGISGGTGVKDLSGEAVQWQDMNIDSRFWASSSEEDE